MSNIQINGITPPPELVEQWAHMLEQHTDAEAFNQAVRWGADQELEACVEWLQNPDLNVDTYKLRAARRPKPPSLKQQACDALDTYIYGESDPWDKELRYNIIREALETLND